MFVLLLLLELLSFLFRFQFPAAAAHAQLLHLRRRHDAVATRAARPAARAQVLALAGGVHPLQAGLAEARVAPVAAADAPVADQVVTRVTPAGGLAIGRVPA